MTPTITALAPWFGGKRRLAPEIVRAIGPHKSYWDVFAGSLSILLAKPRASMEVVNDLHRDIVGLARVIQDRRDGPRLYRRLRRALHDPDALADARDTLDADDAHGHELDEAERAYQYFVATWMGRSGCAGLVGERRTGSAKRYTHNGGAPAKRFAGAVDSIPAWRDRLRHVTIMRECAFRLLARIADEPGAAIYADPPYVEKSHRYIYDFGLHPCAVCGKPHSHEELAATLGRFKRARVVVSYYDDPLIRRLYSGWITKAVNVTKSMASASHRKPNTARATELIVTNGKAELFGGAHDADGHDRADGRGR
ncbi:MAG: DNA adenine methylase [Phycisphaerales bacterium]|nr:DNA adenine methylase [Phycisphaerales bacterium]